MPISALRSQKLRESFGDEAADEMMDWMHGIETERVPTSRSYARNCAPARA